MFAALLSVQRGRYFQNAALLVIVVVGGWLRFHNLQFIEINLDHTYPIWQAIYVLGGHGLPLVSQKTSVLFANPPLTGYLFVPVMALGRMILMPYVLTLTLNSFAIWLNYQALQKLIGVRAALCGTFLFAVNPWIIDYSRTTWVQSLMPFFVSLIFWALVPVLIGKTKHPRRRTLIAVTGLAIFAHTYLLAFGLVAPVAILVGVFRKRVPAREVLIGSGVFAVFFGCYVFGLLYQSDATVSEFDNFRSERPRVSEVALAHAARLVTGSGYALAKGMEAPPYDSERRHDVGRWIHMILAIGLLGGLVRAGYLLFKTQNSLQHDAALILLIWFLTPVIMLSYAAYDVHPFYLLLSIPAGHGLIGWALAQLFSYRTGGAIVIALLVVSGGINGLNTLRFAQETRALPKNHLIYVQSLQHASLLSERIKQYHEPGMAVIGEMEEWSLAVLAGRDIRGIRSSQHDQAMLIPRDGGIYFDYFFDNEQPGRQPILANSNGDRIIFDDGSGYAIWRIKQEYSSEFRADTLSDIGINFDGWTLRENDSLELITFWRVEALYAERGIWYFTPYVHAFDVDDRRILNEGGSYFNALVWEVGDVLVQKFILPPGSAKANLGFYDGVRDVNAVFRFVHEDGEVEFSPFVSIDLKRVPD